MSESPAENEELAKRMLAAGMYWDDEQQNWLPDPVVWYGSNEEFK